MSTTPQFIVTKALSRIYYKGLPSQPTLIATTKPDPYTAPTGPEAYSIYKKLLELGDHHLADSWDYGLADNLRHVLNTMAVEWTSIDALRIVEVGEYSGPAIIWIGIAFGTLSFEEGSSIAHKCRALIVNQYHIDDFHVEIRESRVMRQAGNTRFLDPVYPSDPTFSARNPYTATLGIPIASKDRPWVEGTGGFYLSAGGEDKNIYLATARHVVLPIDKDRNEEYVRKNDSKAREDVIILGDSSFNEKLADIDLKIKGHQSEITLANDTLDSFKDLDGPAWRKWRKKVEQGLQDAKEGEEALETFRREIVTHWSAKEERVFGELAWAPPIVFSTKPGQYTLDLAIVKIDAGCLDANNYRGNTINIGTKYTHQEFMNKVDLHPASSTSSKFPPNYLATLHDQVPENVLINPPLQDASGKPCLVVFKNGGKTGMTIGKANNVSSFTRNYLAGEYMESREWLIIPTDKSSGAFSTTGDSGSYVADAFSRVGGIVTGGAGATESPDVTYATSISYIMKVLHSSKLFAHAHLNPELA